MIKRVFHILALLAIVQTTMAQTEVAVANGSWHSVLSWQGFLTTPTAGEDVIIGSAYTITMNLNGACDTLYLSGAITIGSGADLNVDAMEVNSGAAINVNNGTVSVDELNYDGAINITAGTGNYMEVSGSIQNNNQTKLLISSGAIRIFSELAF